jgi:hypothetical protein
MAHVATKTPYTKQNRNTHAAFLRGRTRILHPVGRPYNKGKNKAKRAARLDKIFNRIIDQVIAEG